MQRNMSDVSSKWTPIASAIDFFEHFLCSNTEIQVLVLASPLPENCTSILNLGVDRGKL